MNGERPNPDELLARVRAGGDRARRGKLRIFFGYAAGVGKTYAMLAAARRERDAGTDVVVGYVEPHGRPETEALLEGLEALPTRRRALSRRDAPRIRSRCGAGAAAAAAPGRRAGPHQRARVRGTPSAGRTSRSCSTPGIDVWTTLNVQHIESLNDVIAQITGVVVRETLPDAVLEQADEIELIDITPEELMERLAAGQGLHSARRPSGRCRISSTRATWSRCASCRCGRRPTGCSATSTRRGRSGRPTRRG